MDLITKTDFYQNAKKYITTNLGLEPLAGEFVTILGALLWLATFIMAIVLAANKDVYSSTVEKNKDWYWAVFAFTILAGFTTCVDYKVNERNVSTTITVFSGSLATFLSLGLWAVDTKKHLSTALVFVQMAANSIQLSAIFNNNREPVSKTSNIINGNSLLLQ